MSITAVAQTVPYVRLGWFEVSPEIKVGDLLTPITVLVTVLTFAWTIGKDVRARRSARADKVRAEASRTLGKLERWTEVALWYYRDIQPSFVDTSDLLLKEFDVDKARDYLWMTLSTAHIKSTERLFDESLETAYVDLCAYYPGTFSSFHTTMSLMKGFGESAYGEMQQIAQNYILGRQGMRDSYSPALLGNDLRDGARLIKHYLAEELENASSSVRSFLIATINKRDGDLINSTQDGAIVPAPASRKYDTFGDYLKSRRVVLQ